MPDLEVELVPALSDNYVFLLWEPSAGVSAVVDPGEAAPVLARLEELGRGLDLVLITHHHHDHIGGLDEVKRNTGCRVVGPRADRDRIDGMDETVAEGDEIAVGAARAKVLDTPGHTRGHISYWFEGARALFCGDTMFALGCGRLLEGDAPTMWRSLSKLAALPEETRVYCGHEYTLSNARFSTSIDPGNHALADRARAVEAARSRGEPTIPTTIGLEKATSPFLRAADPELRAALGLADAADDMVFGEVRRRKDAA